MKIKFLWLLFLLLLPACTGYIDKYGDEHWSREDCDKENIRKLLIEQLEKGHP